MTARNELLDDVGAILDAITASRRTLLVSPELEDRVTEVVAMSWLSGILKVRTSQYVSEGSVYLVDERALHPDREQPVRVQIGPTHYAPASLKRVRIVGESAELGGCDASAGGAGYTRLSTWCAATGGTTV